MEVMMKAYFDFFTKAYIDGDPYYYQKARHTLAFLSIISIYVIMGMISDVLPGNLSLEKFLVDFIVFIAFIGIGLIIKSGHLKIAVNILMVAGLLYMVDYFSYERSLLFYIQAFLALLVGTAVHTSKWQLHFAYTFILVFASYRHYYLIDQMTIAPLERIHYIEQSAYALMGLYVFFFIILFFHYIIENEISQNALYNIQMRRDNLTGLKNRLAFDEYITDIEALEGYTLCYLDLDYFKAINDKYGHILGDETLIAFAEALDGYFEPSSKVFRWGGEEFMIALRGVTLEETIEHFDRFNNLIKSIPAFKKISLTYSGGVVVAQGGDSFDTIMQRCDELLYLAKSRGRNQIAY